MELIHSENSMKKQVQPKCKGFWGDGFCCAYGTRCRFHHYEVRIEEILFLVMAKAALPLEPKKKSKLLNLLDQ